MYKLIKTGKLKATNILEKQTIVRRSDLDELFTEVPDIVPSNLNKCEMSYLLCPETNKHCQKLYSIGGYFLNGEAFKGCMYKSQTQSKKHR